MLEQRVNERTLNSMFRVSVKTTLFAVLSEKLPFSTALLILATLNNDCLFPLLLENPNLLYKICIFPTLNHVNNYLLYILGLGSSSDSGVSSGFTPKNLYSLIKNSRQDAQGVSPFKYSSTDTLPQETVIKLLLLKGNFSQFSPKCLLKTSVRLVCSIFKGCLWMTTLNIWNVNTL